MVGEVRVPNLDCRLVAEPLVLESEMLQVTFPKPDPPEPIQRLLSQLERGILVASNSRGLFVQRLCPIPIFWNAPKAPPGPGPHLLPSNKCVELFSTAYFYRGKGSWLGGRLSTYPFSLAPGPDLGSPTTPSTSRLSLQPVHGAPALVLCTLCVASHMFSSGSISPAKGVVEEPQLEFSTSVFLLGKHCSIETWICESVQVS